MVSLQANNITAFTEWGRVHCPSSLVAHLPDFIRSIVKSVKRAMVRVEFILDKCAIVLNKNRAKCHAGGKLASNTIDSSDEDFLRTEFLLAACTVCTSS